MGKQCNIEKQLQIAHCMHRLLMLSFDLDSGEPLLPDSDREAELFDELKRLQAELHRDVVAQQGYCGAYWWNIPWGDVRDLLENSLALETEYEGWRFETKTHSEAVEDSKVIYVQEDGIYSQFSSCYEMENVQRPHYAQEEIEGRLARFNRRLDNEEDYRRYTVEGMVYSDRTGKVYDSVDDYYNSSEHMLLRYRANEILKNSMYTPVETQRGSFISQSIRYGALFACGSYSVDSMGVLNRLDVQTFRNINARGTMSEYAGQALVDKCESVLCAAVIAQDAEVNAVPVALLSAVIGEEASDFWTAAADAAMLACLGNKLAGKTVQLPEYRFRDEAHYNRIVEIDAKARQRKQLSTEQLCVVLDALNKNLFGMQPVALLEDKAMYMMLLSQAAEDDESAYYWMELCAEVAYSTGKKHKSQRLLEYATITSAMLAEICLKSKQKPQAEKFALWAVESCEALRLADYDSAISGMEKQCQKLLKKARKKGFLF